MIGRFAFALIALLMPGGALSAQGSENPKLLSSWVQMAPGGFAEARAVVAGNSCPEIEINRRMLPMRLRAPATSTFANLLCAATLPAAAASASILGHELPLPHAHAQRVVVLGDTGCRIKGYTVQACNDPARWPFPRVAQAAASLKPDLVIHVGDYLYREAACPPRNAGCAGSPSGDDWPAWAADFFTPAAPLLTAAPFVFVRGNHEEWTRSGKGWLRLLGPLSFDPKSPCIDHVAPWAAPLGDMTLAVMDDSHAPDPYAPSDLAAIYRADLAAVQRIPTPVWLVMHRPIWGIVELGLGIVVGGNRTMMAAQDTNGIPDNVALLLAGHIHSFEAINYVKGAPPQIIAGEGGDLLDHAPRDLSGRSVGALKIASGIALPGYGFLLFTREADHWLIHVMTADGTQEALCTFANRHLDCR
jgi:predicted phosphodiesterase